MPETPVRAIAIIRGVVSPVAYEIELPNGKRIVGHLAHGLRSSPPTFEERQAVRVELTPYDFSRARITGEIDEL